MNNQYRGLDFRVYEEEAPRLLDYALGRVQGDPRRVLVLSIPDYAWTPFGVRLEPDRQAVISVEIDRYNAFMRAEAVARGIRFVDITPISREGLKDPDLVAGDGLHPWAKAYGSFVEEIGRSPAIR